MASRCRRRAGDDGGPSAKRVAEEMVTLYTGTTSATLAGMERYGTVAGTPPSLVDNEKLLECRLAPRTGELSSVTNQGVNSKGISTTYRAEVAVDYATGIASKPMDLRTEINVLLSAGTNAETAVIRRIEIALLRLVRYATRHEVQTTIRAMGVARDMSELLDQLEAKLQEMYDPTWEDDDRLAYVGSTVTVNTEGMGLTWSNDVSEWQKAPLKTTSGRIVESLVGSPKIGQLVLLDSPFDNSGSVYIHGIVTEIIKGRWNIDYTHDYKESRIATRDTAFKAPIKAEAVGVVNDTSALRAHVHAALRAYHRLRGLITHVRSGTAPFELSAFELDPFPVIFTMRVARSRVTEPGVHLNFLSEYNINEVVLTRDVTCISVPADRVWQVRAWVDHCLRVSGSSAHIHVDSAYFGGHAHTAADVVEVIII
jgi:hypothetical protein